MYCHEDRFSFLPLACSHVRENVHIVSRKTRRTCSCTKFVCIPISSLSDAYTQKCENYRLFSDVPRT